MNMAAPSGVVTFLFTDIEGSTRRWEADAEGMRVALDAHNQVLREAIETHAGHVFKYTGRFDEVPYEFEVALSATYATAGEPDQWVELCRNIIARKPGTHALARAFLAMALTFAGATDEALATAEGLVATAEATDNPALLAYALLARGLAYRYVDAVIATTRTAGA